LSSHEKFLAYCLFFLVILALSFFLIIIIRRLFLSLLLNFFVVFFHGRIRSRLSIILIIILNYLMFASLRKHLIFVRSFPRLKDFTGGDLRRSARLCSYSLLISDTIQILLELQRLFLSFDLLCYLALAILNMYFHFSLHDHGPAVLTFSSLASAISNMFLVLLISNRYDKLTIIALYGLHGAILQMFLHQGSLAVEIMAVLTLNLDNILKLGICLRFHETRSHELPAHTFG